MKYLKLFDNHSDYDAYTNNMITPNVSYCLLEDEVHFNGNVNYSKEYLTFEAIENGTISFNIWKSMGTEYITSISYSTDNGETWSTTNNTNNKSEHLTITVNVNEGDKVLWKGDAQQTGYYDDDDYSDTVGSFFSSTAEFNVYGNIMSLLYGDNFYGKTVLEYNYQFSHLFNDCDGENECNVVNAENLSLPATTLADYCYQDMFRDCTSLTSAPGLPATTLVTGCYYEMFLHCTGLVTAPELPATTLASSCYENMFIRCSSLTSAPELPATTLAGSCYSYMFDECTSLTTAPEILPATTLTNGCYQSMFYGCTSLTTAPELPATTLAQRCYLNMFNGCTSLTSAPELPATTLVSGCYTYMFKGCSNLNYIKAMFTTTPSYEYTNYWVNGVASTGTFVKNSAASWNVTGTDGIPSGWTVQTTDIR